MKIRIGKELRISWSILTQGQNQPLEGRNLRLYLQEPNRQRRTLDFTTDANTLLTVLPANTLTRLGNYALILTENEGQEAQTAVDANPAFTLVETTEEEDTPTTEDPNLEVAHINLATGNLTLRMVLQELFAGKEGGDMKTGDILPVLRNGELHRVSAAAVGGGKSKKKIYKGIFHKAVPAYPKDGYAYIYRGLSSFQPAFKMKDTSRFEEFIFFLQRYEAFDNAIVNVFTNNPKDGMIGVVTDIKDIQEILATKQALLEYEESNQPNFYLILVITRFKPSKNVAIYIDNPYDEPVPVHECNVRIVSFYEEKFKHDIEMQSPRFVLQDGNVFCTEIPTIKHDDEYYGIVTGSIRTNFYLRKSKKHGKTLINHFDNRGDFIRLYKRNSINPVRLNCGETKSFPRKKEIRGEDHIIKRGRGIHTIETTVRQLRNSLGGGKILE